jgi:competence protein ComEA
MKITHYHILTLLAFLVFTAPSLYAEPVNINTASANEISAALYGIGSGKAKAIVEYRVANGPFKTPEDLLQVSGIGPKTVASIRHNLRFETATASEQSISELKQSRSNPAPRSLKQSQRR